jgi:hypothetical protein
MRGPNVHGRPDRRIIIERCDAKHDMRLIRTISHDVSAANRTETPHFAGRRFEGGKFFLTRDQTEMIPHDASGGRIWSRMSFAAGRAVTMADRSIEAIDLIPHRSAKAASFQRHRFLLGG